MARLVDKGNKPDEVSMALLGYKDASNVLGLPIGTLYALVSRRQIPHVRLGPRLVRFDLAELSAWVAARCVASEAETDRQRSDEASVDTPPNRRAVRNVTSNKGVRK